MSMALSKTITEDVAAHNVVKNERGSGNATQIGDIRIIWKAEGQKTGFQFSVDEVTLQPGCGIPLHRHPFAEFFYVVSGEIDFALMNKEGAVEWVRCSFGDSIVAPPNAPHTFHNRGSKPATFVGVSTYQHELMLKSGGDPVVVTDPQPSTVAPGAVERAINAMSQQHCFIVEG
jgi:quercetin dioxygenase-like cupin family protein